MIIKDKSILNLYLLLFTIFAIIMILILILYARIIYSPFNIRTIRIYNNNNNLSIEFNLLGFYYLITRGALSFYYLYVLGLLFI